MLVIYIIGFFVVWIVATVWWSKHFNTSEFVEVAMGAAWGLLVAVIWPLAVAVSIISIIILIGNKVNKEK